LKPESPLVRDLVLLGGGHTHVIVIRMWAMNPIPGVRVTLVSQDALTPYSGMLPGLVAGHYSMEQSHIDLSRLCKWAGVRFIEDTATAVSVQQNAVEFASRPPLYYDLISIDTGGAPRLHNVEGAADYTTPVKPVYQFYRKWQNIEKRVIDSHQRLNIGVVGAGAGGFEILLAMQFRVDELTKGQGRHQFHWIIRDRILSGHPDRIATMAQNICDQRKIHCHRGFNVVEVKQGKLSAEDGQQLELDEVLWCTEAQAPSWPHQSGIECTPAGFISISDTLQSTSHANIFAAGDVAIQINHPRPRAGVFAVRQGPVLFKNLQRVLNGEKPKPYVPQRKFLTLLSTGNKSAMGSKSSFSFSGDWVWRWKNWIDQRFMDRFNILPAMKIRALQPLAENLAQELVRSPDEMDMRCGGCGAKLSSHILDQVISSLDPVQRQDQVSGIEQAGDVAIIRPGNQLLAQSVDQIKSLVDDPWLFARIATVHALSDLYAAGASPQSAMALVGLPFSSAAIQQRELTQLMAGIVEELNKAGCTLSGGHTSESSELSIGFVVNGYIPQQPSSQNVVVGQQLILTKPLGTGVLMAGHMRARAKGADISSAIRYMLQSNAEASAILMNNGATSMTDVTGFGLAGHLVRLLRQKNVGCQVGVEQLPCLAGAVSLSEAGIRSTLYAANKQVLSHCKIETGADRLSAFALLFDPQTSGGLVATVPADNAGFCKNALIEAGYSAAIVGEVTPLHDHAVEIIRYYG